MALQGKLATEWKPSFVCGPLEGFRLIRAILFEARALAYGPEGADLISEVLRGESIPAEPAEVAEALAALPLELREARRAIRTEEQEEDFRRAMLQPLLAGLGVRYPTDALLLRLVETLHEYPAYWSIYPETLPVLHQLRERGFRLGVVSNWEPSLHRFLAAFELNPYFGAVVSSMEEGVAKPDPYLFQRALKRLDVAADWALHVGPSVNEDVTGALRAGVRPVWLNRTGIPAGHEVLTVQDLRGLLLLAQKAGE